jgi:predicted extracellular nuclease
MGTEENSMRTTVLGFATAVLVAAMGSARAAIFISEWMYNPLGATNSEYVEITNRGPGTVDLTGWSFDDSSRTPGALSLSSLGTLAVGQSALITETTDAAFRTEWGLSAVTKVLGGSTQNLGRSDEINIYDAANALVDRLTYDDQGTGDVMGPRTQGVSGNPSTLAALGANKASQWVLSVVGDAYESKASVSGDIGSPGTFAIPEPAAGVMGLVAALAMVRRRR